MKKLIVLTTLVLLIISGCIVSPIPPGGYVNGDGSVMDEPYEGPGSPWNYYGNQWYFNGSPYVYYGAFGWGPFGLYPQSYVVNRTVVMTPGTNYHTTRSIIRESNVHGSTGGAIGRSNNQRVIHNQSNFGAHHNQIHSQPRTNQQNHSVRTVPKSTAPVRSSTSSHQKKR